ncbi:MAG: alkaline phosphatase family protein [Planctomycetota bacterium]|nr:alkaline phosphatase family protein [Planctomycetota bacterium]
MPPKVRRVVLVGWDAADWRMIEPMMAQGLMPHFRKLVESGVSGNIASLTPMISPILWTSIATGKWGDKHGILGFAEPDGTTGSCRPVTSSSRTCKAIWNILAERGLKASAINWFASHPAERTGGVVVTDRFPIPAGPLNAEWPLHPGTVAPDEVSAKAATLRIHPSRTTPDQIRRFIPRIAEIRPQDEPELTRKVNELRALLAQCATVHNAATWILQEHPSDFLGVYYDAIDRFAHAFMEFHPPRREGVDERAFDFFQNVMTTCYQFHDMMLGRLVQLAGPEALVLVVSDHGFYSDDLRPEGTSAIKGGKPVAWHRPYGIVAAMGPGVKRGEKIYSASLLDITPTILAAMGLPVGADMDGHVLTQMFTDELPVERIPTHEGPASPEGTTPSQLDSQPESKPEDPLVVQQMIEQLVQLGYLAQNNTTEVVADRHKNLASIYLATGRPKEAQAELDKVLSIKPGDEFARLGIARCHMMLGDVSKGEALVRDVLGDGENSTGADSARAHLHLGTMAMRRNAPEEALGHFQRAASADTKLHAIHTNIGTALLRLSRWSEAAHAFETSIRADPDDADAWDGLGVAYRSLKQPSDAVFAHMRCIALLHARPNSHINLALALGDVGRTRWAAQALRTAAELDPSDPRPHTLLAELCERAFNEPDAAAQHRTKAAELRAAREVRFRAPGSPSQESSS